MENSIKWDTLDFSQLDIHLLYNILRFRQEVFIIEQKCNYLDVDGYDQEAYHLLGKNGETLIAYSRLVAPEKIYNEASIGRIIIHQSFRGKQLGKELILKSIDGIYRLFGNTGIRISAQKGLTDYYKDFGFRTEGNAYMDAGILHIEMVLDKKKAIQNE